MKAKKEKFVANAAAKLKVAMNTLAAKSAVAVAAEKTKLASKVTEAETMRLASEAATQLEAEKLSLQPTQLRS